jgi:hypothetical protein
MCCGTPVPPTMTSKVFIANDMRDLAITAMLH